MDKKIRYFSYRGCNDPIRLRKNSPAADSKIDYIVDVLNRSGYMVELISKASSSTNKFLPMYSKVEGKNTYQYFASFGITTSIFRVVNRWLLDLQFFLWCFFHLKRGETIIVYLSLGYTSTFLMLKRIKKLNIIGEIEELYQDVHVLSKSVCKSEINFIESCSKYLFPTILMDKLLNKSSKPSIIIHGLYSVEQIMEKKYNDGRIHVVYGGTLDPAKGGAIAAVKSAEYLPSNYHLHICGFGEATYILDLIAKVNLKTKAIVTFEGELNGEKYVRFIQKCHIGLSTQNPSAAFNDTSFPSKILVYLSNGLRVVSVRIPVVEFSSVGGRITYYENQDPKEIAQAVVKASNAGLDGRQLLHKLDQQFERNLKSILLQ